METKKQELTVNAPPGFEIDYENSSLTLGKPLNVIFKEISKVPKTWDEIMRAFQGTAWHIDEFSEVVSDEFVVSLSDGDVSDVKSSVRTAKQAKKLIALAQLFMIADHYNQGWIPNFGIGIERKYFAYWDYSKNQIAFDYNYEIMRTPINFKSRELIEEAYKNNKEIFDTFYKP